MKKDTTTGKDREFYELGKKIFDRIHPINATQTLQNKINQALVHLQRGSSVDVVEAIRILK